MEQLDRDRPDTDRSMVAMPAGSLPRRSSNLVRLVLLGHTMYLATVDWATSNNRSSSALRVRTDTGFPRLIDDIKRDSSASVLRSEYRLKKGE
jgi:hypothetical protein